MPDAALYVYGVVRASEVPRLDVAGVGPEGAEIRAISHGGLAAVVSGIEPGPLSAARDLRAHWRVLEEVAANTTVVPVRFGTVVDGEQALVDDFLARDAARLSALLDELAAKVQLNVKAFYDEELLLKEVVATSPAVARLRERVRGLPEAAGYYERIRLGEVVSSEVDRRREQDAELLLARLAPLAVATHNDEVGAADMAVNAAFLVERSGVDAFSAEVAKLSEDVGERMRLRYVGPMPPYSFADAEISSRSSPWG